LSQIYKASTSSPPPPTVATTYQTPNGSATPAVNVINFTADDSTTNNDNGIFASAAGSTITYSLSNHATGTSATTDATLTTIISLPLGGAPGTFYISGNIQSFNASTFASGAYTFSSGYRTDGVTAIELGSESHDTFEDAALTTSDIFTGVSGNNAIVQVQGVVGLNINWNAELNYRQVN